MLVQRRRALLMGSLAAIAAVLAAACGLGGGERDLSQYFPEPEQEPAPAEVDELPSADTSVPPEEELLDLSQAPRTALEAGQKFFALISAERFEDAYRLVSLEAREQISEERFAQRYRDIWEEATIQSVTWEIVPPPGENVAGLEVILRYETDFFGAFEERVFAPTRRQPNWVVNWSPDLIFDGLGLPGSLVNRFIEVPERGNILDRNGELLAFNGQVPVIGVARGLIEDEDAVVDIFVQRLALDEAAVRGLINQDVPPDWFIPVARLSHTADPAVVDSFEQLASMGILVQTNSLRVYPQRTLASHVVGFLGEVNPEELEQLAADGFRPGDLVGRDGIEAIMEEHLAGVRGGRLRILSPDGREVRVIASREAVPGRTVTLTLDIRIQRIAEAALAEQPGAVVALDPRSNEILALVSFPRFDPNDFVRRLTEEEFEEYFGDERQPFVNRTVEQIYAPGSIFKVVTLAAGLEAGGLDETSRLNCPAIWTGLGEETPLPNWKEENRGLLTLAQALAESCNTVFYQIGADLHRRDEGILSQFSAGFGFGNPTGAVGLREEAGINPGPEWKRVNRNDFWYTGDTVNLSIGQGFLAVTPLQISNAYGAIATDGILRRPVLVRSISAPDGSVVEEFSADPIGVLPVSAQTLETLRGALRQVITSPAGTGWFSFRGTPLAAAGKSGTAEDAGTVLIPATPETDLAEEGEGSAGEAGESTEGTGSEEGPAPEVEIATERPLTHAWFVAFANFNDPRLVVTVVIDDGASGASEAGPIVRSILERSLLSGWVQ
ncbi:MAG: penicillin-binding transpeptidase domain-containing protein [Dehalococcoidia bacterium]